MRKIAVFTWALLVFIYCGSRQDKVERYMEDGVEVVVSHLEPYKIKDEPTTLILEEEFSIDTERDDVAETGLTKIWDYKIDSEGSIYFLNIRSNEDLILKFDRKGDFVKSFLRYGQGPGELQSTHSLSINKNDEIMVPQKVKKNYLLFSKNGSFVGETLKGSNKGGIIPLENGKYLVQSQLYDSEAKYWPLSLCLLSPDFRELKELDMFNVPNKWKAEQLSATSFVLVGKASKGNIFTGNSERGYEIHVYDLEGNMVRKIKKEYKPVEISKEYKRKRMEPFKKPKHVLQKAYGEKLYFPRYWHAFSSFFPDEEGRLFVRTYEEGENPEEYIYDIFNSGGVFIGRTSLKGKCGAKNNRLYCLREKESGYMELVVYKMRWE